MKQKTVDGGRVEILTVESMQMIKFLTMVMDFYHSSPGKNIKNGASPEHRTRKETQGDAKTDLANFESVSLPWKSGE